LTRNARSTCSETPQSYIQSVFLLTLALLNLACWVAFRWRSRQYESSKRELVRHQATGDRKTLAKNIEGYLLKEPRQNPPYQFSTMMWQQNDMIYTIIPSIERENILWMAVFMATEQPLAPR
jgi:hypothetical protein